MPKLSFEEQEGQGVDAFLRRLKKKRVAKERNEPAIKKQQFGEKKDKLAEGIARASAPAMQMPSQTAKIGQSPQQALGLGQGGDVGLAGFEAGNSFYDSLRNLDKQGMKYVAEQLGGSVRGTKIGGGRRMPKRGKSSRSYGGDARGQVRSVASQYGWDKGAQWKALQRLVMKESSWRPNAANPTSSARGLFQKMTSLHGPVEGSAKGQAKWGLNYIKKRYGSPKAALAFHERNNWY